MKSIKILSVGSATLDLFFQSDNLPETKDGMRLSLAYGGKYVAKKFAESIGGGGCNAAVSLQRQGFDVYYWGKVDKSWVGKKIMATLKEEGVRTDLVDTSSSRVTTSAILLGKNRERTIVMYRAENDLLKLTSKVKETLKRCQWLYFADLALCPKKDKVSWLKFARDHGVKNFVALSGREYKKGLNHLDEYFALSDIFILNAHELADIWGRDAPDLDLKKINYARKLNLPVLVVTYDVYGSYTYTQDKIFYQPIIKTKAVDLTGAGDAYGSGFLGKYIKTGDIQKAMEFGTRNASSVIAYLTTQRGLLQD
jgi:sugar/nucleoside kinase (ribokinase family)